MRVSMILQPFDPATGLLLTETLPAEVTLMVGNYAIHTERDDAHLVSSDIDAPGGVGSVRGRRRFTNSHRSYHQPKLRG
jgi:hypothetical protein